MATAAACASSSGPVVESPTDVPVARPEIEQVHVPGGRFRGYEVRSFNLDKWETTSADYELCVKAGKCTSPIRADDKFATFGRPDRANHPINGVTAEQAAAFCRWMGRRLPTMWEWEWAARGREEGRAFPWGDAPPGDDDGCWNTTWPLTRATCPVGTHIRDSTRDGILDMAGNVGEWGADVDGTAIILGGNWYSGLPHTPLIANLGLADKGAKLAAAAREDLARPPSANLSFTIRGQIYFGFPAPTPSDPSLFDRLSPETRFFVEQTLQTLEEPAATEIVGFRCAGPERYLGEAANERQARFDLRALEQTGAMAAERPAQGEVPASLVFSPSDSAQSSGWCRFLTATKIGGCQVPINDARALAMVVAQFPELRRRSAKLLNDAGMVLTIDEQSENVALMATRPVTAGMLRDNGIYPVEGEDDRQFFYKLEMQAIPCNGASVAGPFCWFRGTCLRMSADGRTELRDSLAQDVEGMLKQKLDNVVRDCVREATCMNKQPR